MVPIKKGDDVLGTIQMTESVMAQIERKLMQGYNVVINLDFTEEGLTGEIVVEES